jgi:predicted dehydrogenase
LENNKKPVTFAVLGVEHEHIYSMAQGMVEAGAVFKAWWTQGAAPSQAAEAFAGITRAQQRQRILEDPTIDVVLMAPLHTERAAAAIEAMDHGKDVMVDKPGALTLAELVDLRAAVQRTARIWSVDWSERYHVPAVLKAAELARQGAIGRIVQTVNFGSHRPRAGSRPSWWFDSAQHGGIMGYLASHAIDQFLFFTRSKQAKIVSSTLGNFRYPQWDMEDFGDLVLHGDGGVGYARVDWYTPDEQPHPGDNRLFVIGTEGQIEVRKYVDVGGRPGANHLFILAGPRSEHIDCSATPLTYFRDFLEDVRNRTETSAPQEHSFLVNELAIKAQLQAKRLRS